MQSVPITIKVVCSNPVHGEVYSIQHYVIKFVSSCIQGFTIGETETDHWLQLVTFGSYQSPKPTICSIYLQQNLERILVINGSKFAGGNDLWHMVSKCCYLHPFVFNHGWYEYTC